MSHFFAYLSRMKYILRWGLMRNTQPENIQEHSLQVAMIAHALALMENKYENGHVNADRVMSLAVYHEVGEVITGDLATPIKYYNPEIKTAYKKIEQVACHKLLHMLPEDMREEYDTLVTGHGRDAREWQLVKAADRICAYLKCVEELKAGNMEFEKAKESTEKSLFAMHDPVVDRFVREYVPSFSLTLDELN
jgi:5'-deoxynucleotidase